MDQHNRCHFPNKAPWPLNNRHRFRRVRITNNQDSTLLRHQIPALPSNEFVIAGLELKSIQFMMSFYRKNNVLQPLLQYIVHFFIPAIVIQMFGGFASTIPIVYTFPSSDGTSNRPGTSIKYRPPIWSSIVINHFGQDRERTRWQIPHKVRRLRSPRPLTIL